ncbi:MAG: cytidylate kinase family protein [Bacteroidota bacterium]
MENLLEDYLFGKKNISKESVIHPIITISRSHGCNINSLTLKLKDALNEVKNDSKHPKWILINKEIIEHTATELKVKPNKVIELAQPIKTNIIEDVIFAFSNDICNVKTKTTIQNVVKSFADKGNLILVGRAGSSILHDYENALHIKIMAPKEWRIKNIAQIYNLPIKKAKERVEFIDEKRILFNSYFSKNKTDDQVYDLILNRMKLSDEIIVKTIVDLMKLKKMI